MKPGQNTNHPAPNSCITVEPIRKMSDIKAIKATLSPRDLCLFTLGINTNLRASDLVSLKVGQVTGSELVLKERKTGKPRRITLNKSCIDAIAKATVHLKPEDYLFRSQRGEVLTVPSVSRLVKSWCRHLRGNYASHTLRKTWGYHQRVSFKVDIPTLMQCFNHSTQRQTLEYLCIQPCEIKSVYLNEL
nr:tyrosine-type recombinase/integrase [Desulfobacula sp.]